MPLVTCHVHFDCASSHKMLAAGYAYGIFIENFRTKCRLWHVHLHFDCLPRDTRAAFVKFTQNASCSHVHVHFDCAGSHKMLAGGYAYGIFTVYFHTRCRLWHVHVHFVCAGAQKMLAQGYAYGIFTVYFRTKCRLWHVHVHFDCAGAQKMLAQGYSSGSASCDMSMCLSTGVLHFSVSTSFCEMSQNESTELHVAKERRPRGPWFFQVPRGFFLGSLHRDLVKTPLVPQTVWPHWRVLTVTVKARCSIEVASEASGIFPVNFRTKCLLWHVHVHFDCASSRKMLAAGYAYGISLKISAQNASGDMSMCISTAQARAKCLPRDTRTAFSLKISAQNASGDMSMCISTAQARTRCALPGLGIGLPPQHYPPQHHHLPPPPPQHSHQHLLIIIIIIIIIIILIIIIINIVINSNIIIINMIIQFPFTSHTLCGVSCRDN